MSHESSGAVEQTYLVRCEHCPPGEEVNVLNELKLMYSTRMPRGVLLESKTERVTPTEALITVRVRDLEVEFLRNLQVQIARKYPDISIASITPPEEAEVAFDEGEPDGNITFLRDERKRLTDLYISLKTQVEERVKENKALTGEYDKVRGDIEKKNKNLETLGEELQRARERGSGLEETVRKADEENTLTQEELEAARRESAGWEQRYNTTTGQVTELGSLLERARKETQAQQEKTKITSPVQGILKYFETLGCTFTPAFEGEDLEFARKVWEGSAQAILRDYVNFSRDKKKEEGFTQEQLDEKLAFDSSAFAGELTDLENKSKEAEKSLYYIQQLRDHQVEIPEELRQILITTAPEKDYQERVLNYQLRRNELNDKQKSKTMLEEYQKRYDEFKRRMDALKAAPRKLEVLFNHAGEKEVEIYLPFREEGVPEHLSNALEKEIAGYFGGDKNIFLPDAPFLSYAVSSCEPKSVVSALTENVPVLLQLAGYTKIVPHETTYHPMPEAPETRPSPVLVAGKVAADDFSDIPF